MTDAPRRLRIACYVAGLTGLGHYTRTATLAAALAEGHDVTLVNAGRGQPGIASFRQVDLPVLPAIDGRLQVPDPTDGCWAARAQMIRSTIESAPPDVVLVEHYPFSKWELASEIDLLLAAARSVAPDVVVLSSVRDIVGRTRRERIGEDGFTAQVRDRIASFDGLLVHGDPDLLPLSASFPAAGDLPVPVHHTGYVVDPRLVASIPDALTAGPPRSGVLVAAGGGADQAEFLAHATQAAATLAPGEEVVVFAGPFGDAGAGGSRSRSEYLRAMQRSAAAVTRAGYNSVVELWAAGVPAVLVPDRRMSDQVQRAAAFAARGAGIAVEQADLPAESASLADRLGEAVKPRGVIDMDGARRTRAVIEEYGWSRPVDG
jgi:predicted glycosyltransferase